MAKTNNKQSFTTEKKIWYRFKKTLISTVALLLTAAAATGCGSLSDKNDDTSSNSSAESNSAPVSSAEQFDAEHGVLSKFKDKYVENNEFLGHIKIPGTLLDNDVMLGVDNDFYLDHNIKRESDPYGVPFVDYRASVGKDLQSSILTIYGHNSKNGDYFEAVKSYKDIEFYKKHPIIEFDTLYGSGQYKIIGRFTEYVKSGTKFFNYHDYVNLDEALFDEYMKELDKRNYYNSGIDVEFSDQLIALSTCNDEIEGWRDTPYRDVLVARKVRPGESAEVDVEKIEPNEDMIMPKGWQEKFGKENPYR